MRGAMVLKDALEQRIGGRFAGIREGVGGCVHRALSVVVTCASPASTRGPRRAPTGTCPPALRPTVSLGVTYAAACTYGCDDGRIAPTRCAIIDAGLDGR